MTVKQLIVLVFVALPLAGHAQPEFTRDYPDSIHPGRLRSVIATETATYAAGLAFLSFIWYEDQERAPFHWYDDTHSYLKMDKLGHAYAAYRYSYSAYYALRWAGVPHKKALWYGGPIGLVFQTPIEIFDGLYENWGFSWPDMAANALGSALFMVQQGLWHDQPVLMKFSYSPSQERQLHNSLGETHLESFFLDYNAHTYWLSANIRTITGWQQAPAWLNLAVGYSANGMFGEFRNPQWYQGEAFPHYPRYRQWLLSLDVDLVRIRTNKPWLRRVFRAVNLIKVPLPTLEYSSQQGFGFHPIYF